MGGLKTRLDNFGDAIEQAPFLFKFDAAPGRFGYKRAMLNL